jgi:Superfamily II DNA and RNA helicases
VRSRSDVREGTFAAQSQSGSKAITLTVSENLEAAGHDVAVLNGDVPQNQGESGVERLRKGTVNILVATDVAARGGGRGSHRPRDL